MLSSKGRVFLIAGSIFLAAILYLSPRTPGSKEAAEKAGGPGSAKVTRAVSMVNSGQDPMKGIQLLKEVLEKNPRNAEALWHLGRFSMQTGQNRKALERFEKVLKIAPERYPNVKLYVARIYANMGKTEKGIRILEEYREKSPSDTLIPYINRMIESIREQNTSKSLE